MSTVEFNGRKGRSVKSGARARSEQLAERRS